MLQGQNAECKAKVNNKLHLVSKISKNIHEYNKKIKTKKKCEFCSKCIQEVKYNELIKDLNKEYPGCFEDIQPHIKMLQCSEGHLLFKNCFKKISDSTFVLSKRRLIESN